VSFAGVNDDDLATEDRAVSNDPLFRTVADVLGVSPDQIDDGSSPDTLPSWDSLMHLNLVMAIEEEFQVSLTPDDTLEMRDVGRIRSILHGRGIPVQSAAAGVQFMDCPEDFIPRLREFFADMYSPEYVLARDERFLRWQFSGIDAASPGGPLRMKIALVDGQLAGCVGYVPVDVQMAGRVSPGAWAANWMVDDRYRRLGLGPLLIRELSRDFDVALALGGNSDAHQLLPRMGWTDFGNLPRYVRVLDERGAALLTVAGELRWPAIAAAPAADSGLDITRVDSFDERAAALWDRTHGESDAGTRRSAEFLNWRYTRHPNFDYVRLVASRGGAVEGFAVYRIEQARDLPVRIGRMVELVASPVASRPLIAAVIDGARQSGAAVVDFFCSSRRVAGPLLESGFLPGTESPAAEIPMLFQPVDRGRVGVLFMAHLGDAPDGASLDWYVTTADGDQDRPS